MAQTVEIMINDSPLIRKNIVNKKSLAGFVQFYIRNRDVYQQLLSGTIEVEMAYHMVNGFLLPGWIIGESDTHWISGATQFARIYASHINSFVTFDGELFVNSFIDALRARACMFVPEPEYNLVLKYIEKVTRIEHHADKDQIQQLNMFKALMRDTLNDRNFGFIINKMNDSL